MTPEEFQKIKDAEKEHLRSLKELKQAVRNLERQKKLTGAVSNITKSEDLLDNHDSLVDKLAVETAHNEARLEIALESAAAKESIQRAEEARNKLDSDLQQIRAKDLVRQLKTQMGETDTPSTIPPSAHQDSQAASSPTDPISSRSDAVSSNAEETDLPEKTLGRMRKN